MVQSVDKNKEDGNMNLKNITRETTEMICFVLEKEKNRDGLLFTSMRELSRKINQKDVGPKEVAVVLNQLEEKGVVKTLKKSNRQTVLEVGENLLEKNIDIDLQNGMKSNKVDLEKVAITPKKLIEFIIDNMADYKLTVTSKSLCDEFRCKYSQLMATLNLLQRSNKIRYMFNRGIIDIDVIQSIVADTKEDNISYYSNNTERYVQESSDENALCVELDGKIVNVDAVFDDIGETMRLVFEEQEKLRRENAELKKKLALSEISLKKMREDRDYYSLHLEQMKERNNRLFNQIIELKSNK